jgi:two-component system cell cycle sensor histidine kinase/response regulator CckA
MKRLIDYSIRSKLTIIVMATTCAALLVAVAALGFFELLSVRNQLRADAVTTARIVANNSTAVLSFEDPKAAAEVLDALRADMHLGAAAIYNAAGQQLASYQRVDWPALPVAAPDTEYARHTDWGIEVAQPVLLGAKRIGSVILQLDNHEFHDRLRRGIWTGICVLLLAAGTGYLLTVRLQRFLVQPIQELAGAARVVATEKKYSVRVTRRGADELGDLVEGFNEMLLQIEQREKALHEAQSELERRVGERTRELFATNQKLYAEVGNHKRAREESDALRDRLQKAYEHLQEEARGRALVQGKLQASEERFSKAFKTSPVPMAILARDSRMFLDVNDRFVALTDTARQKLIGSVLFSIPLWTAPETRARVEQLLADGQSIRSWECKITGPDGKSCAAILSAESFLLGQEQCVLLVTEDVSERASLEGQLRQAQKMEAVGQLAAGVAHDFNNLLTVVQGYTQLLLAMQPPGSMGREALEKIISATQRAAGLTSQLLTFSRKRVAEPRAVELNKVVANVTGMLRPLLGENIRLNVRPATTLPAIMADAAMLEQVIVNLAVNARDAMPKGGDLVISTFLTDIDESYVKYNRQAAPGQFVCLQVSDGGMGMDTATMERIFEPFFTTKGVGKGTGLGLATVYGIVKQHRGWVEVNSQLGVGTTFKVFLPAVPSESSHTELVDNPAAAVRGGAETILVVEDEAALRELVTKVLRNYGYQVLEAAHGKEALRLWQSLATKPALLLTDMMMPEGMTGWELAARIRQDMPDMKVLFTSGYSPEIFGTEVQLDENSNFLPKPYHPRLLARTVRSCLDCERPERPQPILS